MADEPLITATIPQLPAYNDAVSTDDLITVFDVSTGTTRRTPVNKLPFSPGGGGGTVTQLGSPFPVRNIDSIYHYDNVTGNSTITDVRLLGKSDYAVTCTQLGGGEFRDDMLQYNADAGSVTIIGFQLEHGEKIRIYADGVVTSAINALIGQISILSQICAPFLNGPTGAGGGKVLWMKAASLIPAGWQECIAMRGVVPIGFDPTDADFNKAVGTPGGAKTAKLTAANLPAHIHQYRGTKFSGAAGDIEDAGLQAKRDNDLNLYKGSTYDTSAAGNADPDAFSILPPNRIVYWIEFIGLS
jgi:hypothetical protein